MLYCLLFEKKSLQLAHGSSFINLFGERQEIVMSLKIARIEDCRGQRALGKHSMNLTWSFGPFIFPSWIYFEISLSPGNFDLCHFPLKDFTVSYFKFVSLTRVIVGIILRLPPIFLLPGNLALHNFRVFDVAGPM